MNRKVDRDDWIWKQTTRYRVRIYRMKCTGCESDLGYCLPRDAKRLCRFCAQKRSIRVGVQYKRMLTGTIKCSACDQIKGLDSFYKSARTKSGYRYTCKSCEAASSVNNNKRWDHLRRNYNLTKEDYTNMVDKTQGCCYCCYLKVEKLYVDHCHDTGKIRGLLCRECNAGIGLLGDKISGVLKALTYLEKAHESS